ncbi:MAG: c-type cytochrome [Chitinophagaceae bacterium]|nr:c-type cytochrome [Chitinophagaceae bacterium]
MKAKFIMILSLIIVVIITAGFKMYDQENPWPVPDKFKNMKNPVNADAESLKTGKALWAKHCQSCHGKTGLGDGSKAAQLKTDPGNFSAADFHKQTDGSIFYKTSEGRDDMPGFKKKIPDQDEIWSIVNFVRTLKK